MNRMKHLVVAVVVVIAVVTGLSVTSAWLRHEASAGEGGEHAGHTHGGHGSGTEMTGMGEDESGAHSHGHDDPAEQRDAGHQETPLDTPIMPRDAKVEEPHEHHHH